MRYHALVSFSLAALLIGGCSSRSAAPQPMSGGGTAGAAGLVSRPATVAVGDVSPDTVNFRVGIRLTGESAFTDARYGRVLGYFKGTTSTTSQVVSVRTGMTIRFISVEPSLPHTLSFLGNASSTSAPWPPHFNGSSTRSAAGT